MATVYLAEDRKHGRKVAIKVLHPELSAVLGIDRFLAEIKLTASLQHPHILGLLDSGAAAGRLFYVMPHVAGESLRTRLSRENQLPITAAVRLTVEVADALEYAHQRGIVHRDIKPENILLQGEHALVADFGIALAVQEAGGSRMTQTGLSLGTPQYMSPEQAAGERSLSGRSDIYALGAVLYELLTGDPPFTASTVQGVLAKVMAEEPSPPTRLRKSVPPHVEAAVLTALAKLPADRFATAGAFAQALTTAAPTAPARSGSPRASRARLAAAFLAALALAAGYGAARLSPRRPVVSPGGGPQRLSVLLPDSAPLAVGTGRPAIALSPRGDRLLYVARLNGQNVVLAKDLRSDSLKRLPGSAGGTGPIISPSGSVAGFFVGSTLIATPIDGGRARRVESITPVTRGAVWLTDSTAGVATDPNGSVLEVPIRKPVTREKFVWLTGSPDMPDELSHAWPELLPGGRGIVYVVSDSGDPSTWRIAARGLPHGSERLLVEGGSHPRYMSCGHLVFVREGALWAVAFDAERLQARGDPVLVQPGVLTEPDGLAHYAVSAAGMLVFASGGDWRPSRRLAWISKNGLVQPVPLPEGMYEAVALAPDGRRVAVVRADGSDHDVWLGDLARGTVVPITRDPGEDGSPAWSPDGRRLALATEQWGSPPKLAIADLAGPDLRLLADTGFRFSAPTGWSPDGSRLFLGVGSVGLGPSSTASDIAVLEDSVERMWLQTAGEEGLAVPSPDGRWVAYVGDETGQPEVYLRPLAGGGAPIAVSTSGGTEPRWGRATGSLYFRQGDDILRVEVTGSKVAVPDLSTPRPFVKLPSAFVTVPGFNSAAWDIAIDEQRVLAVEDRKGVTVRSLHVVLDWSEVVRAAVP